MKTLLVSIIVILAVGGSTTFADGRVHRTGHDDAPAPTAPQAGAETDREVIIEYHGHGGGYSGCGCTDKCGRGYVPSYGRWHHRIRGFQGFETNWSNPWWHDCDHCGGQPQTQEPQTLDAKPLPALPTPAPADIEKSTRRINRPKS